MSEIFSVALSGMRDSVLRIRNAVTNIVNASSTSRLPSSPQEAAAMFQPKDAVTLSQEGGNQPLDVTSVLIDRDPAYRVVAGGSSPLANEEGLIAEPNVDLASEIVATKMAELTYKANAAVIKAVKENDERLLDTLI